MKYTQIVHFLIISLFILMLMGCSRSEDRSLPQLEAGTGDYVARFNIRDYGAIDVRLFSNAAPEIVEDFITQVENESFVQAFISSVIEDYYIEIKTVSENTSERPNALKADDKVSDNNIKSSYYPIRGALCTPEGRNDASNILIISSDNLFIKNLEEMLAYKGVTLAEYLKYAYGTTVDENLLQIYRANGGAPWLMEHCTVFGQIYQGFEVLDAISRAPIVGNGNYSPTEDLIVDSVVIVPNR